MLVNGKKYNYKEITLTIGGVPLENVSNITYTVNEIEQIRSQVPKGLLCHIEWTETYINPRIEAENKKRKVNFIIGLLTLLHLR